MKKIETIIQLVQSMTKTEKKNFKVLSNAKNTDKDYIFLFNLIDKKKNGAENIKSVFLATKPKASFEITSKYLYKVLMDSLLTIREEQDNDFFLYDKLLKVKILFEKSLYDETFVQLHKIQTLAGEYENYPVLLLSTQMELEYLLSLDFHNMTEKQVINKQLQINKSIEIIRKIREQASLYELLKLRISRKNKLSNSREKKFLDDLLFSELNISNSLNISVFEINKLHLLFQSNYLIKTGNHNQALQTYYKLNKLFEKHKHLWANPPIYYLNVLEGILSSLRSIRNYDGMSYFIEALKNIESTSVNFKTSVLSVIFTYELAPLIDRGMFSDAMSLTHKYEESLLDKLSQLNINQQAQVKLQLSVVYYLNQNMNMAKKLITEILSQNYEFYPLPLFTAIRLVNLIYLYDLKAEELIRYESRSIKRDIKSHMKEGSIEDLLIQFVNTPLPITQAKRMLIWEKFEKKLCSGKESVQGMKIPMSFDFASWIEAKIKKEPLNIICHENNLLKSSQ